MPTELISKYLDIISYQETYIADLEAKLTKLTNQVAKLESEKSTLILETNKQKKLLTDALDLTPYNSSAITDAHGNTYEPVSIYT